MNTPNDPAGQEPEDGSSTDLRNSPDRGDRAILGSPVHVRWIPRLPSRRSVRISITGAVVLVILYVGLLVAYFQDGHGGAFDPDVYDSAPPAGGVLVSVTTRSVDPVAQTMSVQVRLDLDRSLDASGYEAGFGYQRPNTDIAVTFLVQDDTEELDQLTFVFAAAQPITGRSAELLFTGYIRDWPFDRYSTDLIVLASAGDTSLPVDVSLAGSVQNWSLTATPADGSRSAGSKAQLFDLQYHRSLGTVGFGIAVTAVLIALPVLGLTVAIGGYRGRRRVEPAFLGWIAALLFATVPLRNFLPGSPPPGSWVDVAVVLWVLVALTVALVFAVRSWWRDNAPDE